MSLVKPLFASDHLCCWGLSGEQIQELWDKSLCVKCWGC